MSVLKTGKFSIEKNILTTPKARLAFAALHQPKPDFNDKPSFQATFLFDPEEVDLTLMRKIAKECLKNKNPKATFDFDKLFRDGDTKPETDGYPGHVFVQTKSKPEYPPLVFDQSTRKVGEDDIPGVASGDYVLGLLRPYAWEYKGSFGVSLGLVGVQLVKHGERFATGAANVESLLEELPVDVDEIDEDELTL